MVQELHPPSDELEAYSLGLAADADLEEVEEHLLICERCQNELALTDRSVPEMKKALASPQTGRRLRSFHITEDGPVFGAMHRGADGKWVARHWGRQLDGGRICDSVEGANAYLMESFHQMFPEHVCSGQCWEELARTTSGAGGFIRSSLSAITSGSWWHQQFGRRGYRRRAGCSRRQVSLGWK
jgi:hypothetical protein